MIGLLSSDLTCLFEKRYLFVRKMHPLEVGLPTLRTAQLDVGGIEATMDEVLDFAESRREIALLHLTNYQNALSK